MKDRSGRKGSNHFTREHLIDEPQVLMREEHTVIIYNDTAALLAAMLQSTHAIVTDRGCINRLCRIDSKNTAFFM